MAQYLYAVKYDGDPELYLVQADCLEEAEDNWVLDQQTKTTKQISRARVDVRTILFDDGVARVGELFAPSPVRRF